MTYRREAPCHVNLVGDGSSSQQCDCCRSECKCKVLVPVWSPLRFGTRGFSLRVDSPPVRSLLWLGVHASSIPPTRVAYVVEGNYCVEPELATDGKKARCFALSTVV